MLAKKEVYTKNRRRLLRPHKPGIYYEITLNIIPNLNQSLL